MRKLNLFFKENVYFLLFLFFALTIQLTIESLGLKNYYLPNIVLCIVFSFGYLHHIPLWVIAISVIICESFFSSAPVITSFLTILGYFLLTKFVSVGRIREKNYHIIIFILSCIVIYSTKILWLFLNDSNPEVSTILIKMLMTIIFFPIFYIITGKLHKLL